MTAIQPPRPKTYALPANYYTDLEIYRRELKTIWRSTWQWVGRLEDLANPGDYLTTVLGEEPIFVVKNAEGELLAMHNVCPHRGARLLPQKQGSCKFLQCPYHAWTFDLSGKLLAVAQPGWFPDLDKSALRLAGARVDGWGGFVFVNPDPQGESLAEYLAGVPDYLNQYGHRWEDLRQVAHLTREEPINWKFQIENFVEDYHFATVHAETLAPLYDVQGIGTIPTGRHINIPVPYAAECPPKDPQRRRWQAGGISYQGFIFPNITYGTSAGTVFFSRYIPLGPTLTRFEAFIYQTPAQHAAEPYIGEAGPSKVGQEDTDVCVLLQEGVRSRAYQIAHLAEEHELGISHFYSAVRAYLG
ncbi:MAG: aromatic ring-hydroxylating dioxygenase subunit alpha [Aphanocapsa lilacina HA4352-LM1]|jgi:phenylpropionate dioxygenase-like ring-hydroxylating dioxygenase large terminal subunit|nr:aromatic ring-hydroxylating dioxygenase subunit alpha [Aphanocapsa lilacina HA4352-LM1]